jgi:hypothetical protein
MSKSYTQQEVEARAARILAQSTGIRLGTINEFYNMAAGESEYGLREKYYPNMPNQFFKDVLKVINSKLPVEVDND